MNCIRCNGLALQEVFLDVTGDLVAQRFTGWRCLACGEVTDPVILANRGGAAEVKRLGPKTRWSRGGTRSTRVRVHRSAMATR